MAIVQTGSTLQFDVASTQTGTVSTTITVPDDAEIVLVGWSGYSSASPGTEFVDGGMTFTKGGTDTAMTRATTEGMSASWWHGALYYLVLPDTGTNKSLKWSWGGALEDADNLCSVTFWKGIDTSSTVRDAGGGGGTSYPHTTSSLTAQSGDKIVAWAPFFSSGSVDTWSGLTSVTNITAADNADGAWAAGDPTGDGTVAASTGTSSAEGAIFAVVLKPAITGLFSRPSADDTDGGWTDSAAGTNLFAQIDETSASDADYIRSANNPSSDTCKVHLSDPGVNVTTPINLKVRYARGGDGTINLTVKLFEGTTELWAKTYNGISASFTTATETAITLNQPISDETNLYASFIATAA